MNKVLELFGQEKISKLFIVVFFSLLLLYGGLIYDDYGISSDEPIQRHHSIVMYNDLFLKDETYQTLTINTEELPTLKQYGVPYGVILQLPLVWVEHMNDFEMTHLEIYEMRHLYNFLWFFVSVIFFYRLAMVLTEGKRYEALLGTLIYVLGPRTLADSFYNIKDALCMALFTISMYYGVMTIRKLTVKNLLLFALFSALCTASRIVGGVVVAACMLVLFLKSIEDGTWKKIILGCMVMGVLFVGIFIAITPNAWSDIPGTLLKIIKTFSNYTTWNANVKYFGQWINAMQLPWHYLFVWIGMTVPVVYLGFTALGAVNGITYCIKNRKGMSKHENKGWIYLAVFLILAIPFMYVIVVRPVLYNGWRHFYFMYSVIAALAVMGIHALCKVEGKEILKIGGVGLLGATFLWVGAWILKNHPYEYVYYNTWIREYAADHFQRDYWFVTEQEALQYIVDTDQRNGIPVFSYQGYTWMFEGTEDDRLVQKTSREAAEYIIADEEDFVEKYLFENVYSITVDGMDIRNVYKRTYDPFKRIVLQTGGDIQEYELNGVLWTKEELGEQTVYQGTFTETMPTDVLAVIVSDAQMLENGGIEIYVSGDEETWHNMKDFPEFSYQYSHLSAECSVHNLKSIRIICSGEYGVDDWIEVVLCGFVSNVNEMDVSNPLIQNIITNVTTDTPTRFMMDADGGTRWTTPAQQTGMNLIVELEAVSEISAVKLELKESPWDYPRSLQIAVSMDGEHWRALDVTTEDNEMFRFDKTTCKYMKFELGETTEDVRSNWSIYEIRLFSTISE